MQKKLMRVSIFIRTYHGDVEWLKYCLQSIHKNLVGWDEIVICIPEGQESHLANILTTERLVLCPQYTDDYIGQQISKLQAHHHAMGDCVLFVDSDVVFKPGADVSTYFIAGRPVILKERYELLEYKFLKWRDVVRRRFGVIPEYEYMRRAPQLFLKETLIALEKTFPDMESYAISQPYRHFSEFNILGFFAESYESGKYHFVDLKGGAIPEHPAIQNWSWGGINEEIYQCFLNLGIADPLKKPNFTRRINKTKNRAAIKLPMRKFRHAVKRLFFSTIEKIRLTLFERKSKRVRLQFLLNLVRPISTEHKLIRIGGEGDGGYLVPDILEKITAVFSPGVDKVANFENEMADKNIPCFLADYSVESPPVKHPLIDFEKKFIGPKTKGIYMSLDNWITRKTPNENNLLLQMDIEGAEYEVIESVNPATLKRFGIIIIEIHSGRAFKKVNFRRAKDLEKVISFFEKLLVDFEVVHIHPNNCLPVEEIASFSIPPVLEFTLMRKDFSEVKTKNLNFPHPLDRCNVPTEPDFPLPDCWYK